MRTILFSLTILLTFQSVAQRIGVKAGLALASYNAVGRRHLNPDFSRTVVRTSLKPGLIIGSQVDFKLNENLFLRQGAEMVVKGSVEETLITYNGVSNPIRANYNFAAIDFPIQLLYKMETKKNQQLLLAAGIVPGILIEGGLNKGDLGVGVMAGCQFASGLNYNITYNHGLLNVATHSFDYTMLRNRYLGVTVGYQFRPSSPGSSRTSLPITPSTSSAKAVFAELGGTGGFLSINYDTRLTNSNKGWGLRVGAGTITDLNSFGFTLPFGLNYLAGAKSHFFETALGTTYFSFSTQNQDSWFSFRNLKFLAPYLWVGYRYQPNDKRFFFRGGFNQFFASGLSGFVAYPFPGFSFGYSFR